MSRFLIRLGGFGLIQAAIFAALVINGRVGEENHYMAATVDKHRRAAELEGPRLLLVGGSNVAFGVDSPELEKAFGLPAVNLALNAELGADFMLAEAEDVARPGDVMVVSLEHEHFVRPLANATVVMRLIEARPESYFYLSNSERVALFDTGLAYVHSLVRRGMRLSRPKEPGATSPKKAYSRKAFNEQGDVVGHHDLGSHYTPKGKAGSESRRLGEAAAEKRPALGPIHAAIDELNQFAARCAERNIRVYFSQSARSESSMREVGTTIDTVDAALAERLTFPLITDSSRLVFADDDCFDTPAHLTHGGKVKRTAVLIEGLARYLPKVEPGAEPQGRRPAMVAEQPERKSRQ